MDIQYYINYGVQSFNSLPPEVKKGIKIGAVGVSAALILPIALKALGFHAAAGIITGAVSFITGTVSLVLTGASLLLSVATIAMIAYLAFILMKGRPLPF